MKRAIRETGWLFYEVIRMGMTLVKIMMPTTQDGALVDWEKSVQAYREKEKRKWEKKNKA